MVKRILVPLDHGTEYEAVLPVAADLARSSGATVRLLHVAPCPVHTVDDERRAIADSDRELNRMEAQRWLASLQASQPALIGVTVERTVRFGRPAKEILNEADAFGADLVVVTTTGHRNITPGLLGSVAEQVSKQAACAVLLLRPTLS